MKVNYYINGQSFESYGVKVSKSMGLIGALKMKDPPKVVWPDHHGEVVDLTAPRYEARQITLECFLTAANSTEFISTVKTFVEAWHKPGLQRLMIDVNDGVATRKPLLYEVYISDEADLNKKWNASKMVGTFNLKLREPEPVKTIYKFISVTGSRTASIELTTEEPVNIYWGDGEHLFDVTTDSGTVEHVYSTDGTFYIIITGVIENITGITTGATLVWNRL
jgi:hypothetical protein